MRGPNSIHRQMLQGVSSHVETQPGCGEYIEETAGTTTSGGKESATVPTSLEIAVRGSTATANKFKS